MTILEHTTRMNINVREYLNFNDIEDFELARKGLLLQKDNVVIKTVDGKRDVWNLDQYSFLKNDCPDSVNPSLWRVS